MSTDRTRDTVKPPACPTCGGGHWVCENHPDRPWCDSGLPGACVDCGGAGAPCPGCNPLGMEPPMDLVLHCSVRGVAS